MAEKSEKVVWVTGAGSGIGEAAALALGAEGTTMVLTGRRIGPLEKVAAAITALGGTAHVQSGDLTNSADVGRVVNWIRQTFGRLDVLVNSAGLNIAARAWSQLTNEGVDQILRTNLSASFYCVTAVLPIMREQKDGLLIHIGSWSGRYASVVTGPAYNATKHGMVMMSQAINMEECVNGIRSCVLCPGEVDTPLLDKRPKPISAEDRARMLKPADLGNLIRYIADLPPNVCLNEAVISPTWNRAYVGALQAQPK
jgi:NADP-dependent 3-hydroxy acid dehydrogenase YdfG